MTRKSDLRKALKEAKEDLDAEQHALAQAIRWHRIAAGNYMRAYDRLGEANRKIKCSSTK